DAGDEPRLLEELPALERPPEHEFQRVQRHREQPADGLHRPRQVTAEQHSRQPATHPVSLPPLVLRRARRRHDLPHFGTSAPPLRTQPSYSVSWIRRYRHIPFSILILLVGAPLARLRAGPRPAGPGAPTAAYGVL